MCFFLMEREWGFQGARFSVIVFSDAYPDQKDKDSNKGKIQSEIA